MNLKYNHPYFLPFLLRIFSSLVPSTLFESFRVRRRRVYSFYRISNMVLLEKVCFRKKKNHLSLQDRLTLFFTKTLDVFFSVSEKMISSTIHAFVSASTFDAYSSSYSPSRRGRRFVMKSNAQSGTSSENYEKWSNPIGRSLCSLTMAMILPLAPSHVIPLIPPANSSEIEILQTPRPAEGYIVDDAGIVSRATSEQINKILRDLEEETGYRLNVVTVRKLEFEQDPYLFGDKVLETWYPTLEEGNDKGNFLLVKTSKEVAVVGGPKFLEAVGKNVLESILSKNVPIALEYDKFNEAIITSIKRISAVLEGKMDPGPPQIFERKVESNFKKPPRKSGAELRRLARN